MVWKLRFDVSINNSDTKWSVINASWGKKRRGLGRWSFLEKCGHWCQDLGPSLGFGALAPRGENFEEEKRLAQVQQQRHVLPLGSFWSQCHGGAETLTADAGVCLRLSAEESGFFFSSCKQGELADLSEHVVWKADFHSGVEDKSEGWEESQEATVEIPFWGHDK